IEAEALRSLHAAERALQRAVAVTIPRDLRWTEQQIGLTRRDLARLWRRVRGLPAELGAAAIGAIAVATLARMGMSWFRCSNWRKIGKSGCRMPGRWLEDLLALTADFFVLTNVCTVLPWLEAAASEVGAP